MSTPMIRVIVYTSFLTVFLSGFLIFDRFQTDPAISRQKSEKSASHLAPEATTGIKINTDSIADLSDVSAINALITKHTLLHNGSAAFTQEDAIKEFIKSARGYVGLTPITDNKDDRTEYGVKILHANLKASDIAAELINADYPHQSAKIIGYSKDGAFTYVQISLNIDGKLNHILVDANADMAWYRTAKEIRALYNLPYSPDVSGKRLYEFPLAIQTPVLRSFLENYVQNEAHSYADLNTAKTKFDNADVVKN